MPKVIMALWARV